MTRSQTRQYEGIYGDLPSGVTMQQAIDWSVETMKAGCDYSAEKGIMLGLEDHGRSSSSITPSLKPLPGIIAPGAR